MASRSLLDLAPAVRHAALAFLERASAQGMEVLIYCTLRSEAEQAALYARGRTAPGTVVTHARPGQSLHGPDKNGQSWAFDAVPIVHGKAAWNDVKMLEKMGACGKACGLEWAGSWRGRMREKVHFQLKEKGGESE